MAILRSGAAVKRSLSLREPEMTKRISRRAFLHGVGILGASAVVVSVRSRSGTPRIALQVPNGTIHPFTSTSGVHVPPMGVRVAGR
jgi:hypothetical protein